MSKDPIRKIVISHIPIRSRGPLRNRTKLMRAFYTLLLWNPYLRLPASERIEPKTRFKTWWSSVGAPIEVVSNLMGGDVDFTALFAENEVGDDEADGVAVICEAINDKFGGAVFAVKDFCIMLDAGHEPADTKIRSRKGQMEIRQRARHRLAGVSAVDPRGPPAVRAIAEPASRSDPAKATNRPVRLGDQVVRLVSVHSGHAGKTYRLEVL